jgi:hypothetical protein
LKKRFLMQNQDCHQCLSRRSYVSRNSSILINVLEKSWHQTQECPTPLRQCHETSGQ